VRYTNLEVLAGVAGRRRAWRRHVPAALLLAALASLCVAFARPTMTVKSPNERASVVLVVDTSGSMRATDVKPTRLGAARSAMRSFLDRAPSSLRIGIVSFSDEAQVVVSPTVDRKQLDQGIDVLVPGFGTALGDGIARAVELARAAAGRSGEGRSTSAAPLKDEKGRSLASILLLSDGAQTAGGVRPLDAAKRAADLKIPVSTIALGTRDATVEVPLPGGLKQLVKVPPDPQTLRRVAESTGGRFFEAPTAADLDQVYKELGSRLGRERRSVEVTSVFAGLGAILLLAAGGLSSAWFRRAL
jgi:Ca-activated chloride channel family protein